MQFTEHCYSNTSSLTGKNYTVCFKCNF